jgi:hypothetical protein
VVHISSTKFAECVQIFAMPAEGSAASLKWIIVSDVRMSANAVLKNAGRWLGRWPDNDLDES